MSFLSQPVQLILIGPQRRFGTAQYPFGASPPVGTVTNLAAISAYVTINESATDSIEITQQPVQQGAPIADHAFIKPASFSAQISFRDNQNQSLSAIYASLLSLQSTFTPFPVVTPKRSYSNMLLETLNQTTDKKTENCLAINISFRQVIIVKVGALTVQRSQLANPGSNGATQNTGTNSSVPFKVEALLGGG